MGRVIFEFDPPYELPPVHTTSARAAGDSVEVTLHVFVPGQPSEPFPIRVRMTTETAIALTSELQTAAIAVELSARIR